MILLVDTHVVAWLASEPEKLSRNATQAMERARRSGAGLAIASITLFELANLIARRRILVDVALDQFLGEIESRFILLPLKAATAERAVRLPASFPNDPMDRIIAATALVEALPLVTADAKIQRSGVVETIW